MKRTVLWYRPDEWNRWREVCEDWNAMPASYETWREKAEGMIAEHTKAGMVIHKVPIEVDEFVKWIRNENRAANANSRIEFGNQKFAKIWLRAQNEEPPDFNPEELKQAMKALKGVDTSEVWEPFLRRPKAAVCPIFRLDDEGMSQFGSGVLVQIDEAHFLLTAAHVTDERKSRDIFIPSKDGFINLFGLFLESVLPTSGCRKDDRIDFACVRLDQKVVRNLHHNLIFLDADDCDPLDQTVEKDAYTIIGYPAAKNVIKGDATTTGQFSLSGEGVKDFRNTKLGLCEKRQILIQFRPKRAVDFSTGYKIQPPSPFGMSGGGIFAWSKSLPKMSALAQPNLVAIVTEFHESLNVFVGTRIGSHLSAIHRDDPSLPIGPIKIRD